MADNEVGKNDFLEAHAYIGYAAEKNRIVLHERMVPDIRARFAMDLLQRWGLISARPDGDDTSGRQKIRLSDPDEIARHAVEISERAFDLFKNRGWLVDIGTHDKMKELAKEEN